MSDISMVANLDQILANPKPFNDLYGTNFGNESTHDDVSNFLLLANELINIRCIRTGENPKQVFNDKFEGYAINL